MPKCVSEYPSLVLQLPSRLNRPWFLCVLHFRPIQLITVIKCGRAFILRTGASRRIEVGHRVSPSGMQPQLLLREVSPLASLERRKRIKEEWSCGTLRLSMDPWVEAVMRYTNSNFRSTVAIGGIHKDSHHQSPWRIVEVLFKRFFPPYYGVWSRRFRITSCGDFNK